MMQKSYGATERFDGIQKIGIRRHEVFYGLFEDDGGKYNFRGTVEYRPNLNEVRDMIIEAINAEVDRAILSDFVWTADNGTAYKAWLSTENQFNYKSAYDLAVQTGGATLPVTFKFGTAEEPSYHEFTTLEELSDFYVKAIKFIQATLQRGWALKDGIDMSNYGHVVEL